MEILLWLLPAAVVTSLTMAWAGWVGREGRGEVDRETAVRRLGRALDRPRPTPVVRSQRARPAAARSTGVVLRPGASASQPEVRHDRAS